MLDGNVVSQWIAKRGAGGTVRKMNWGRVALCGFLTGLVWGVLYAVAFPLVGGHRIPGNVPGWPFQGTSSSTRTIVMTWPVVGAWQYKEWAD